MACRNSASWSCANGRPSSINTLISCRLTAAAAEQKTSSGMNQMKEQIIPSSPWMTCSSDPESVFASLASLKALSAKFSASNGVCERVCVFACFQVVLHLNTSFKIPACRRWASDHGSNNKHKLRLNLGERWMSALMYNIFPLNLRAETQAALSLPSCLPFRQWSSICSCFPVCLSQFWPTWHLPDLENRKYAASWLSPLNSTQPFFPLSASPAIPGALNPSTAIDRMLAIAGKWRGMRSRKEGGL